MDIGIQSVLNRVGQLAVYKSKPTHNEPDMDLVIADHPQAQQYQTKLDGRVVAFAEYRLVSNAILFTHTEVSEDLEGQGVGSQLIRWALEDVKSRGLMIVPMCPFVAAFIQRHLEEYLSLVHPAHRKIFGL